MKTIVISGFRQYSAKAESPAKTIKTPE